MKEYSSTDVCRATGINYYRLREWLDGGFLKIKRKAVGQAERHIFSETDLFRTHCFAKLLSVGLSRTEAKQIVANCSIESGLLFTRTIKIPGEEIKVLELKAGRRLP